MGQRYEKLDYHLSLTYPNLYNPYVHCPPRLPSIRESFAVALRPAGSPRLYFKMMGGGGWWWKTTPPRTSRANVYTHTCIVRGPARSARACCPRAFFRCRVTIPRSSTPSFIYKYICTGIYRTRTGMVLGVQKGFYLFFPPPEHPLRAFQWQRPKRGG